MTYTIAVKWTAPEMSITADPGSDYKLAVMLFDADASVAVLCKDGGHRAVATAQISGCNEYGLKFAIHSAAREAIGLWQARRDVGTSGLAVGAAGHLERQRDEPRTGALVGYFSNGQQESV